MTRVAHCPECRGLVRPAIPETEAQVGCPHCLAQFDVELVMWWEVPALIAVDPVIGLELGEGPKSESLLPIESTPSDVDRSLPWTMLDQREPRMELITHSDDHPDIRVPSPFEPSPVRIDRRDRHARRRNPFWEIAKIVGGGVAGLLIAQLILWWLPAPFRRDPFGLAARVPSFLQFIVPEDKRADALAAAKWEVPDLPPVVDLPDATAYTERPSNLIAELPELEAPASDEPAPSLTRDIASELGTPSPLEPSDTALDPPEVPPTKQSTEESIAESTAESTAKLSPPAEQIVATPSQVDPEVPAAPGEAIDSDDVAPRSPELDPEPRDEAAPTPTNPPAANSMAVETALPEPESVPPALVGSEVAQPATGTESTTEPKTDVPPEQVVETAPDPSSTAELPALPTEIDVTPADLTDTPPDALVDANAETLALAQALTQAKGAVDGFATTSPSNPPARVVAARQMYERLCELAERAATVDANAPDAAGPIQEAAAVLERISQEPLQLRLLGRSAASWIVYPRRVSQGIALAGQVTQIRPMGPWIEVQLQLHGRPNVTMPVLMLHSAAVDASTPLELGRQLIVLGVIVGQEQDELAEYTGTFPVVKRVLHVPFGS